MTTTTFFPPMPISQVDSEISGLLNQETASAVSRQSTIFPTLGNLIAALAGSGVSADLRHYINSKVSENGKIVGRAGYFDKKETSLVDENNEYVRPNGQKYYARPWSGIQDVQVLRKAQPANLFPLLYGPPGTGKTALSEAAFGDDLRTIVISADTESYDLIGQFIPDQDIPGAYIWQNGILTQAVIDGKPLLLDEIGLGNPKVMSVLYPLMDGRDELIVTSNPAIGVVKAAPGFFLLGAYNPNVPGVQMSEALLSRFTLHVEVTTDWELATQLGVDGDLVRAAKNLYGQVKKGAITWSPQFRELLAYRDTSEVFGAPFATQNLLALCPPDDLPTVSKVISSVFGQTILPARI